MGEEFTRQFTPELEIRSVEQGGDGRTIVGIAVPYGRPQRIDASLTEQFARGAFNQQILAGAARRVAFAREHMALGGTLIGSTQLLRDDAAGLYGEFRVSKTPAGEETLELIKDGALRDLSVGFQSRLNRRLEDGTVERQTAHLREVSVVMEGAYGDAAMVSAVRRAVRDEVTQCPTCAAAAEQPLLRQAGQVRTPMLPPPP